MKPQVLYAEVPGFYAEVERRADPALASRPVIVGGDPRKGGLVQAATADARAAGVREKMPVLEALELCPHARALLTDLRRYRDAAAQLRACLRRGTERLEPAGLGAAYLAPPPRANAVAGLAAELCRSVRERLGLPLRVGAAPVKFVAKLAAEEAGDAGVRVVAPEQVKAFLAPLEVARLPGVGPNTQGRLAALGVRTVGDLAALAEGELEAALGQHGLAILAAARGEGDHVIRGASHPQTLSQESTLENEELDRRALAERLEQIAERLERALRLEGLAARRIALKVRYADHAETTTRSRTLPRTVRSAADLHRLGLELLGRTQAGVRPVRLLGLAAGGLVPEGRDERQLELFPTEP